MPNSLLEGKKFLKFQISTTDLEGLMRKHYKRLIREIFEVITVDGTGFGCNARLNHM